MRLSKWHGTRSGDVQSADHQQNLSPLLHSDFGTAARFHRPRESQDCIIDMHRSPEQTRLFDRVSLDT